MIWRSVRVLSLIGIVAGGLIAFLVIEKPSTHKLVLKAYFADGMNLRAGAKVRVAGIDVGSVKSVRVRPELKETPVEVVMVLSAPYDLEIPSDSTAMLSTAGVLGPTYVLINISNASGPPIGTNAVLRTQPTSELNSQEMLKKLDEILKKMDQDLQQVKVEPTITGRK